MAQSNTSAMDFGYFLVILKLIISCHLKDEAAEAGKHYSPLLGNFAALCHYCLLF